MEWWWCGVVGRWVAWRGGCLACCFSPPTQSRHGASVVPSRFAPRANTQAGTKRFKHLFAEEEEKHSLAKIASGSTIEETEVPYTPGPPEQPVFRQRGASAMETEGGGSDVGCLWCVCIGVVLSLCLLVIYVYKGP